MELFDLNNTANNVVRSPETWKFPGIGDSKSNDTHLWVRFALIVKPKFSHLGMYAPNAVVKPKHHMLSVGEARSILIPPFTTHRQVSKRYHLIQ
jgi:hypothetical protein